MSLEGKHLGRYQIVRLLGSGGMGEVYLAEDPRIHQQVALKVIRSELSPYAHTQSAQEAARLFQREARAIAQLDHPHILPLYEYGETPLGEQTLVYLVMPYRPEGSLSAWIRQHFPEQLVPLDVVAHVVRQAAQALQHAHDHQIIHQDVKPSNFLLRERTEDLGHPDMLLADFGIARLATSTASSSQNLRGTPTYMSPEQCVGHAVPASDQYALAVMTYELLTGRPPFQGNTVHLLFQHLQVPPAPPSSLQPGLSPEVDGILLTALAKKPEERFRRVTAFATAFQQAAERSRQADASTLIRPAPVPESGQTPRLTPDLSQASTALSGLATNVSPADALPAGASTPHPAAPTGPTIQLSATSSNSLPGFAVRTDPSLAASRIDVPPAGAEATEGSHRSRKDQPAAVVAAATGTPPVPQAAAHLRFWRGKGRLAQVAAALLLVMFSVSAFALGLGMTKNGPTAIAGTSSPTRPPTAITGLTPGATAGTSPTAGASATPGAASTTGTNPTNTPTTRPTTPPGVTPTTHPTTPPGVTPTSTPTATPTTPPTATSTPTVTPTPTPGYLSVSLTGTYNAGPCTAAGVTYSAAWVLTNTGGQYLNWQAVSAPFSSSNHYSPASGSLAPGASITVNGSFILSSTQNYFRITFSPAVGVGGGGGGGGTYSVSCS